MKLLLTVCVVVVGRRVVCTRVSTDPLDRVMNRVTVGVVDTLTVFVVVDFTSVTWLVAVMVFRLVELVVNRLVEIVRLVEVIVV